jgi:hypothetical protein
MSGNVHDRNVVNITRNRPYDGSAGHAAKNVADFESNSYFCSANEPNQSVCFDFKIMQIKPTHYAIRTLNDGQGGHHLKNWVIERSADGTSWVEIDRQENNNDLNRALAVKTFAVSKVATFHVVRLRQIDLSHANTNFLCFTVWDLWLTDWLGISTSSTWTFILRC